MKIFDSIYEKEYYIVNKFSFSRGNGINSLERIFQKKKKRFHYAKDLSFKKFLSYSFKSLLKFAFQIKNLIQSNSFHIYTPYIQEKFKNSSLHACQTDHEFSIRNFHRNFHPYSLLLSLPRNFSRNFIQRK